MADDRYDWLDKDAAERLLRGDPVSAPDADGARELQQLLDAAAAVGAGPAPGTELPGEAAAMAAFRDRRGSGARSRRRVATGPGTTVRPARPGGTAERTRFARPFRRGFAVALAVCAISGVAVAAGTGVLPTPFQGGGPEPGSSVSASGSPGTLESRDPGAETDGPATRTPGGSPRPGTSGPTGPTTPGGDPHATSPGTGRPEGNGQGDNGKTPPGKGSRKKLVLELCRAYESGKGMDPVTRRRLEQAAGGPEKVHAFCRTYLAKQNGGRGDNDGVAGGVTTGGQDGGGKSGEDDDEHAPAATTSPRSGLATHTTTPAPTPSATTPAGTPSTSATGQV